MDIHKMALPPCHFAWQVTVINGKLNLMWNQRSVDVALGLPFDIASYGLLLHLLSLESGFEPGQLIGFLADTHIYVNHVDGLREQMTREPKRLSRLDTDWPIGGFFDWEYTHSRVTDYECWPKIKFNMAV
jgi:thymidylate synthase